MTPFLSGGGLSVDSYKAKIKSLLEDHSKTVASGDDVSGDREGEDDELVMILERIRAGDALREEEDAAVKQGAVLEDARKAARASKVRLVSRV